MQVLCCVTGNRKIWQAENPHKKNTPLTFYAFYGRFKGLLTYFHAPNKLKKCYKKFIRNKWGRGRVSRHPSCPPLFLSAVFMAEWRNDRPDSIP